LGMEYKISHFGGARAADELVIYENVARTGTNAYGVEAVVENGIAVSVGSNDRAVPENGFVVSGHGSAALFIKENIFEGVKVSIDREKNVLTVINDDEAKNYYYTKKLGEIKQRSEKAKRDVSNLIRQIQQLIDEKNYEPCRQLLEEAYYRTCESKKG